MKTVRLIIKGKVQGVFYRASAKDVADLIGVKGWIKNLPNDDVEIVASATEDVLQKFIGWCKQGPPKARVDEVVIEETNPEEFKGFKVLR